MLDSCMALKSTLIFCSELFTIVGRKAYMKYLDDLYKRSDIAWYTPVELFKVLCLCLSVSLSVCVRVHACMCVCVTA